MSGLDCGNQSNSGPPSHAPRLPTHSGPKLTPKLKNDNCFHAARGLSPRPARVVASSWPHAQALAQGGSSLPLGPRPARRPLLPDPMSHAEAARILSRLPKPGAPFRDRSLSGVRSMVADALRHLGGLGNRSARSPGDPRWRLSLAIAGPPPPREPPVWIRRQLPGAPDSQAPRTSGGSTAPPNYIGCGRPMDPGPSKHSPQTLGARPCALSAAHGPSPGGVSHMDCLGRVPCALAPAPQRGLQRAAHSHVAVARAPGALVTGGRERTRARKRAHCSSRGSPSACKSHPTADEQATQMLRSHFGSMSLPRTGEPPQLSGGVGNRRQSPQ